MFLLKNLRIARLHRNIYMSPSCACFHLVFVLFVHVIILFLSSLWTCHHLVFVHFVHVIILFLSSSCTCFHLVFVHLVPVMILYMFLYCTWRHLIHVILLYMLSSNVKITEVGTRPWNPSGVKGACFCVWNQNKVIDFNSRVVHFI